MQPFRLIVSAADAVRGRAAALALSADGCEVTVTDGGSACVEVVRAIRPDLLLFVPPLLWASVAGVLAVLHEYPDTCAVPVLIFDPLSRPGPLPQWSRASPNNLTAAASSPRLAERAYARLWAWARPDAIPAP